MDLHKFTEVISCILHNGREENTNKFTITKISNKYNLNSRLVKSAVQSLKDVGFVEVKYQNGMTIWEVKPSRKKVVRVKRRKKK